MSVKEYIFQNNQNVIRKMKKTDLLEANTVECQVAGAIFGIKEVLMVNSCVKESELRRILLHNGHTNLVELFCKEKTDSNPDLFHYEALFTAPRVNNHFYFEEGKTFSTKTLLVNKPTVIEFVPLKGCSFLLHINGKNNNNTITIMSNGIISFYSSEEIIQPIHQNTALGIKLDGKSIEVYINGIFQIKIDFLDTKLIVEYDNFLPSILDINDGIFPYLYDYGTTTPLYIQIPEHSGLIGLPLPLFQLLPNDFETDFAAIIYSHNTDFMIELLRRCDRSKSYAKKESCLTAACQVGDIDGYQLILGNTTGHQFINNNKKNRNLYCLVYYLLLGEITLNKKVILFDLIKKLPDKELLSKVLEIIGLIGDIKLFEELYQIYLNDKKIKSSFSLPFDKILKNCVIANQISLFSYICSLPEIVELNKPSIKMISESILTFGTTQLLTEFMNGCQIRDLKDTVITITDTTNFEVIKKAIELGSSFNESLFTLILTNFSLFKMVIELDSSKVNSFNGSDTLLHYVANKGNEQAVRYLISKGVDTETTNKDGIIASELLNIQPHIAKLLKKRPINYSLNGCIEHYNGVDCDYHLFKKDGVVYGFWIYKETISCGLFKNKKFTSVIQKKLPNKYDWEHFVIEKTQFSDNKLYIINRINKTIILRWDLQNDLSVIEPIDILMNEWNYCIFNDTLILLSQQPDNLNNKILYQAKLTNFAPFVKLVNSSVKTSSDILININGCIAVLDIDEEVIENEVTERKIINLGKLKNAISIFNGTEWIYKQFSVVNEISYEIIRKVIYSDGYVHVFCQGNKHILIDLFTEIVFGMRTNVDITDKNRDLISLTDDLIIGDSILSSEEVPKFSQTIYFLMSLIYDTDVFTIMCIDGNIYYELFLVKTLPIFKDLINKKILITKVNLKKSVVIPLISMIISGTTYFGNNVILEQQISILLSELINNIPDKIEKEKIKVGIEKKGGEELVKMYCIPFIQWQDLHRLNKNEGNINIIIDGKKYRTYKAMLACLFPVLKQVIYKEGCKEIVIKDSLMKKVLPYLNDLEHNNWREFFISYITKQIKESVE
ncbi:hypothetical protein EDI_004510 [Entamoeba dispar SAW760]|uniref:Uncharacterized protein n=1 Tax=Entamoeba dispar (strain ATCC PRA-260 / SAW760) TaxID=370354 RepID=B0E8Y7_ENTDS|nr:uncharacterized protein EDI_004510 [Entamoeba dispar SAW760]EDR29001.1 hypothetical protein EDI_004510 [Entamoeba dispar SAW760]|eukprot:EDR29001.1 hypothetical protein EDI_004510 [Entamoeba dispar SAW760]